MTWPTAPRWQLPWPRVRWAAVLLLATFATTTVVGARLQWNFARGRPSYSNNTDLFPFGWGWRHPGLLAAGLPFSLSLLAILLAHELGHFIACRRYRLDSTWPMFLPAPTLLGTLGAFIHIRSPFRTRRELFDVGIAGPLAGMAVAVPLLAWGLWQSHPLTAAGAALARGAWIQLGWPPLMRWTGHVLRPRAALALSPVAVAAWTGLLVTMLNLIPGAQLDGGHIVYAVSPRLHAVTSWSALILLSWAGWRYWPGWWFFAGFIALLRVRHPRLLMEGDGERLGATRAALAVVALVIFVVTFTAAPVFTP